MSDRVEPGDFAGKFRLALEALNWSRTRCARELGLDKSVVSRWASGGAVPTEHNLSRFTDVIRTAFPGFPANAWRLDAAAFAAAFRPAGSAPPPVPVPRPDQDLEAGPPSIAVLAFNNMSGDPVDDFFADGMAEDLITELSRSRSLRVTARGSSFVYKGRSVDARQIGQELEVRYLMEGSVRRAGNQIRINAQLIEAATGNHVWADRYDRGVTDIFAVQDEITAAVSRAVTPVIAEQELRRAIRRPPGSIDAWAAYQRGLWHLGQSNAEDTVSAGDFFRKAIDLDANFAGPHRGLAWTLICASTLYQQIDLQQTLHQVEAHSRRAVALDAVDAEARACLSTALLLGHADYEGAWIEAERALSINPYLSTAYGELGRAQIYGGRPREGLASIATSIKLDPRDVLAALRLNEIGVAHYFLGDYEQAVEAARHAIRSFPGHPNPRRWLTAALGQLGRTEEAKQALADAVAASPASFDMFVRNRVKWHRPSDYAHMVDGLRKAGWQG